MSSEKLISAIKAINSGDKATALRLLSEIVRAEPANESAWFYLSECVDDTEKKKYCLNRALSINPNNQNTLNALAKLEQPPQPAFGEIIPNQTREILTPLEETTPVEDKSEITASLKNSIQLSESTSPPNRTVLKTSSNKKKKYIAILGGSLITVFCGIFLLVVLIKAFDLTRNAGKVDSTTSFNESDAIKVVQNFKAPSNKGMTCKEVFDSIAYVYKYDLGISDATVKWSATKQSDTLFIVHADLKGETGWANFSWQVKFPEQRVTALGEINLCKP